MLPHQRWRIAAEDAGAAARLAGRFSISPLLAQVMLNRGLTSLEAAERFLTPEQWVLPEPRVDFPDLERAVARIAAAIERGESIAICGDYDCDGMTSTALLLRAIRALGGQIDYAIPSRMREGYGINRRIVDEFHAEGCSLILTVDNGISAYEPIAHAVSLGMGVIVTDHHDLPERLPPADAILNPKLIDPASPYAFLAGVGVAYVLAEALAAHCGRKADLGDSLLELYTLGTVADLAPLVGVNRAWVRRGLAALARSQNPGVRALMVAAGFDARNDLKPEAIGFGLGPRINAVGRLADPQVVIELLTTDDPQVASELAAECERCNGLRQQLCAQIEQEAVEILEAEIAAGGLDLAEERVLVVGQPDWHHGVIGIVASRLKERYGAPVFIYAVEEDGRARGSARGIPEFHVFEALKSCHDLLVGYGGHPMAGGFSLDATNLSALRERLVAFARTRLEPDLIAPLVEIDARARFIDLTLDLSAQIDRLQPCGLGNAEPVFWTPNVRVVSQKTMGKTGDHLNLKLDDGTAERRAVVWRKAEWLPLPEYVDVAFTVRASEWQGVRRAELEIVGMRASSPAPVELPLPAAWPEGAEWHDHRSAEPFAVLLALVREQQAPVLLYGRDRPALPEHLPVHYDRPQLARYDDLLLWTLPPSPLHLAWLLSVVRPRRVHLFGRSVLVPHAWLLQRYLKQVYHPATPLAVLRLAQEWWVSPRAVFECLTELGYLDDWRPLVDRRCHPLLGTQLAGLDAWYASGCEMIQKLLCAQTAVPFEP